jgi:hypothetical protein
MAIIRDSKHNWLIAFVVLALAMRMVVPAGWMPSFADGRATIMLCTGAGMVEAWVDADGKIHKESPAKKGAGDQPCAFAGLNAAADTPALDVASLPLPFAPQTPRNNAATAVAIGLGLAAPPPPATAPPALI